MTPEFLLRERYGQRINVQVITAYRNGKPGRFRKRRSKRDATKYLVTLDGEVVATAASPRAAWARAEYKLEINC